MRLGKPPAGYGRWSLQLLADELVSLEVVDSISPETVRKTLKNGMTKRRIEYWVIPPEQDAEFVACMEEVLETYEGVPRGHFIGRQDDTTVGRRRPRPEEHLFQGAHPPTTTSRRSKRLKSDRAR
jgi:hypothetical protein